MAPPVRSNAVLGVIFATMREVLNVAECPECHTTTTPASPSRFARLVFRTAQRPRSPPEQQFHAHFESYAEANCHNRDRTQWRICAQTQDQNARPILHPQSSETVPENNTDSLRVRYQWPSDSDCNGNERSAETGFELRTRRCDKDSFR